MDFGDHAEVCCVAADPANGSSSRAVAIPRHAYACAHSLVKHNSGANRWQRCVIHVDIRRSKGKFEQSIHMSVLWARESAFTEANQWHLKFVRSARYLRVGSDSGGPACHEFNRKAFVVQPFLSCLVTGLWARSVFRGILFRSAKRKSSAIPALKPFWLKPSVAILS